MATPRKTINNNIPLDQPPLTNNAQPDTAPPSSSISDSKYHTPAPTNSLEAYGGFFGAATAPVTGMNAELLASVTTEEEAANLAREIVYHELNVVMQDTKSFQSQAEYGALNKLISTFSEEAFKSHLKSILSEKKLTQEEHVELLSLLTKNIAKYNNLLTAEEKSLDQALTSLGKGYKKVKDKNYADCEPVRELMQTVLQQMVDTPAIQIAFKNLYKSRDDNSISSSPALLVASGYVPEDKASGREEEYYCLISISSADTSPELIDALINNFKDTIIEINNKKHKILISHRLSGDFQELINKTLGQLNDQAKENLQKHVHTLCENIQNINQQAALESYFDSNKGIECILQQHDEDSYKTCAERYFIADETKSLLLFALGDMPFIHIESMDCVSLAFSSKNAKSANNIAAEIKSEASLALTANPINAFASPIATNNSNSKQKTPASKTKASAKIIGISMSPAVRNEYFKRRADLDDTDQADKKMYYVNRIDPCKACKKNRPLLDVLFSGAAEVIRPKLKELTNATLALVQSPFTQKKSMILCSFRKFIEKTPISKGFVRKQYSLATAQQDSAQRELTFPDDDLNSATIMQPPVISSARI